MKAKQRIKYWISKMRILKKEIKPVQVDKKMCSLHPEWIDLTNEERKKLHWYDVYAHKCYKNIFGGGYSDQFVSGALYEARMLPKLNKVNYTDTGALHKDTFFIDKNYQDVFVDNIMFPDIVLRNIDGEFYDVNFHHISIEDAIELCSSYPSLVFKRTIGAGHGAGVQVVAEKDYAACMMFLGRDFIVQKIMKQHKSLAYYNESSVNIIRITSLFWKGKVYILGGILRIGVPGEFRDIVSKDGQYPLIIPINENGELDKKAVDCDNGYVYGDVRGRKIEGSILKYAEMKELVKKEHIRYPHHKILGWDLTLDENGNIRCIEYNAGVPGIVQSQFALGAIFAQKTERGNSLLEEILQD